jgi:hypothetical protein
VFVWRDLLGFPSLVAFIESHVGDEHQHSLANYCVGAQQRRAEHRRIRESRSATERTD